MTTHTTTEAAALAGVTTATIREWIRIGAVVATKQAGKWAITADSLTARIALGQELAAVRANRIAARADYAPYKDKAAARAKVAQLVEDGALVSTSRTGLYQAVSSDGTDKYLVDAHEGSCQCRSWIKRQYCSHLTAAQAIEAAKPARPRLALVA